MTIVSELSIFKNRRNFYRFVIFCWELFTRVQDVKCENLIYKTEFTSQEDWMIFEDQIELSSDLIFECWNQKIFGRMGNIVIANSFYLPPHYIIGLRYDIYDYSFNDFDQVLYLDEQWTYSYYQRNQIYQCDSNQMSIYNTFIELNHYSSTLQIQIFRDQLNPPLWGITNFELYVFQCPPFCHSCDNSGICNDWRYLDSMYEEKSQIFVEGWFKNNQYFNGKKSCGRLQFLGQFAISDEIQYPLIIQKAHQKIRLRFKVIFVGDINCYYLNLQLNQQQISYEIDNFNPFHHINLMCGQYQSITTLDDQFQHNITNLLISIQISFNNPSSINHYFGILDFEIFIDTLQEKEIVFCNDKNIYAFDGCFNLQFDCNEGCSNCVKGQCLECGENWLYDSVDNNCNNYCGDGKIVGFEECDDFNQIPFDGCYNCQFSCPLNCTKCQYGLCLICNNLFQLINNNCISISIATCGDGIIQDFEQCDDGNTIPYDGCFECQYQCQQNCIDCQDKTCLQQYIEEIQIQTCNFGFYLIDNKCLSICGDKIVASDEKCDDENNEPFDGCFKCQYSCSLNCQNCIDGQCINCENGFQLENNKCQEKCGNGIKTFNEVCDDGNILSDDGCSEICQIEIFWNCIIQEKQRSLCFQINNPILQLQFLNTTFNKQYILMISSQKVKLKESHENLTQNLNTSIINVNPLNYNITFVVQGEPTFQELNHIQYLFIIELLNQLEVELIFHIYFNITLVNNYDLQILNKELQVQLANPIVLSQEQKEISKKTNKFNTIILIILGVSAFIILLSGNPKDCFEVLDSLQYQSYLRFINIPFPENVFIYFQSSELISFQTFIIKFNLVDLFQEIFGSEFLDSFGKFYFYSINADLLINFQSQISQIVLFLFFAIFYYVYVKLSYKKCFTLNQMINISQQKSKILDQIIIILYQINEFIINLGKIFSVNGLIIWLLANSWDFLFKIILYLYSKPQNSFRTQLSIPLCIGIMLLLIAISINYLINTAKNQRIINLKIYRHKGLLVIKKFLFLFFLIKAQDNSIIQCIMIALINTIYLGIIILAKLLKNKIDKIVIFWFEMPIIFFTLLSLSHHPDIVKHISNNQQILIGFVQIAILCFGLLSPLIKYCYIIFTKVKDYIMHKYKSILAQKQKQVELKQIFL